MPPKNLSQYKVGCGHATPRFIKKYGVTLSSSYSFAPIGKATRMGDYRVSINPQTVKMRFCTVWGFLFITLPVKFRSRTMQRLKILAQQGILTYCGKRDLPYLCTPTVSFSLSLGLSRPLPISRSITGSRLIFHLRPAEPGVALHPRLPKSSRRSHRS